MLKASSSVVYFDWADAVSENILQVWLVESASFPVLAAPLVTSRRKPEGFA